MKPMWAFFHYTEDLFWDIIYQAAEQEVLCLLNFPCLSVCAASTYICGRSSCFDTQQIFQGCSPFILFCPGQAQAASPSAQSSFPNCSNNAIQERSQVGFQEVIKPWQQLSNGWTAWILSLSVLSGRWHITLAVVAPIPEGDPQKPITMDGPPKKLQCLHFVMATLEFRDIILTVLPQWCHSKYLPLCRSFSLANSRWKISKTHEIVLGSEKPGDRSRTWVNGTTSSTKFWFFFTVNEKWWQQSGGWVFCISCSYQSADHQIQVILKVLLTILCLPDKKSHLWDPFPKNRQLGG